MATVKDLALRDAALSGVRLVEIEIVRDALTCAARIVSVLTGETLHTTRDRPREMGGAAVADARIEIAARGWQEWLP